MPVKSALLNPCEIMARLSVRFEETIVVADLGQTNSRKEAAVGEGTDPGREHDRSVGGRE